MAQPHIEENPSTRSTCSRYGPLPVLQPTPHRPFSSTFSGFNSVDGVYGEPTQATNSNTESLEISDDLKSIFKTIYRKKGTRRERRDLNVKYQHIVGSECEQCAVKRKKCIIPVTAMQCVHCPGYMKCTRVPIMQRLRVRDMMGITDEQYDHLLRWFKKDAEDELLQPLAYTIPVLPSKQLQNQLGSIRQISRKPSSTLAFTKPSSPMHPQTRTPIIDNKPFSGKSKRSNPYPSSSRDSDPIPHYHDQASEPGVNHLSDVSHSTKELDSWADIQSAVEIERPTRECPTPREGSLWKYSPPTAPLPSISRRKELWMTENHFSPVSPSKPSTVTRICANTPVQLDPSYYYHSDTTAATSPDIPFTETWGINPFVETQSYYSASSSETITELGETPLPTYTENYFTRHHLPHYDPDYQSYSPAIVQSDTPPDIKHDIELEVSPSANHAEDDYTWHYLPQHRPQHRSYSPDPEGFGGNAANLEYDAELEEYRSPTYAENHYMHYDHTLHLPDTEPQHQSYNPCPVGFLTGSSKSVAIGNSKYRTR
ncbi:hypothetical protein BDP27DRAFT_1378046 [Rhodocollybia butyracea]|uniref:Uncharacterized protein n=1 Tax=Rhodocollybia butyracea TaxID=206335 RepID=A0A9P5TVI1_9AGAR|nr:hypothetical protein BDP27DRAFT_1378046 [Rhodocollybia butyracea]